MLFEFLEKALQMGCDEIEIEYECGKKLITAFRGSLGVGIGSVSVLEEEPLFKQIDDLKRRKRLTVAGTTYKATISEYIRFGEWACTIKLKEVSGTGEGMGRGQA